MQTLVKNDDGKVVGTETVFINPDAVTSISKHMYSEGFVVRISDDEVYVISQQELTRILPKMNLI